MRWKITFFIVLFILFICFNLYSIDIYISKLQAFYNTHSGTDILAKKVEFISTELKKELMRQSSDIITYDDLGSLVQKRRREYEAEPITDTLDALAVCFFYNIDFIMFGELYIGGNENQYKSQIVLYSKKTGDIIHTIEFSRNVENDITYAKELANTINQELMVKLAGYSEETTIAEGEDSVLDQAKDTLIENTGDDSSIISDQIDGVDTKVPKKEEKIFGIYISLGYFLQFAGEWADATMPCTTLEEGVLWSIRLINKQTFDFYLRPSILFNYSFSVQDPFNTYHRYIHYHSLTGKVVLDFFFEFNDKFGFFIGFGPQYKVDIIDFRTSSDNFNTDIPYALGVCGNAGIEFSLNKAGTLNLGLNNVIDLTFYSTLSIDYKILTHFIFKI